MNGSRNGFNARSGRTSTAAANPATAQPQPFQARNEIPAEWVEAFLTPGPGAPAPAAPQSRPQPLDLSPVDRRMSHAVNPATLPYAGPSVVSPATASACSRR